jgi:hypothetical protein
MTLALATLTSDGIILTADSRQTYRNNVGMVRIGSDNATKLFKLTQHVGVAIAGKAFLSDSNGNLKNVGHFIEEFRTAGLPSTASTKEIAQLLIDYLTKLFVDKELESLKARIATVINSQGGSGLTFKPSDGNIQGYSFVDQTGQIKDDAGSFDTIDLIVAGVDQDKIGRSYRASVPKGILNESDTQECGAMWIGQGDVLARIVLGYDPIAANLDFVKAASNAAPAQINEELSKLRYIVNWGTMTLQDAIDFNVLITRTTESIQRFSDGTVLAPGGVTGVGGEIGVAAVLLDQGFTWIRKKQLTIEGIGAAALQL